MIITFFEGNYEVQQFEGTNFLDGRRELYLFVYIYLSELLTILLRSLLSKVMFELGFEGKTKVC